ncbi:phage baseplate assembly protein W [Aminobacter aganoensis]|uniref:Phage baseplate assembly protein W n=1 Tax=Aminobacter aganoensis TaxID=83264 RepID=A0A7X0KM43_9HYPH|nr:hypothetical protein [Aminobacter aganoensis]MBB6355741.1 phage baseplate assembly protein W [Aminobacter aganoensis]
MQQPECAGVDGNAVSIGDGGAEEQNCLFDALQVVTKCAMREAALYGLRRVEPCMELEKVAPAAAMDFADERAWS